MVNGVKSNRQPPHFEMMEYHREGADVMVRGILAGSVVTVFLAIASSVSAVPQLIFTTLGTNSGPMPNPQRSEPANLIQYDGQTILIDAGDGASTQFAKVGVKLGDIQTIMISHLHFDHIGGLFAVLAERYQSRADSSLLTIYGPSGTKFTVDRMLLAMQPGMYATGWAPNPAATGGDNIKVVEIADGSKFKIGNISVTSAQNTHYATMKYTGPANIRPDSLSYRFDTPTRSVCYTGDTGPSSKVEKLCHGVDLLVSEVTWPKTAVLERIRRHKNKMPDERIAILKGHFFKEHLSATNAGLLAKHCAAKALVLTHIPLLPKNIPAALAAVKTNYDGPVTFAEDMQKF